MTFFPCCVWNLTQEQLSGYKWLGDVYHHHGQRHQDKDGVFSSYLRRWHCPQWYILGSWVLIGPEWSRDQDTGLSLGPQWYILGSRQKDPIKDTIQLLGGHSGGGSWGSGDREQDWARGMSVMMGADSGTWSGGGYKTWHDMMTWHQRDNNIITSDNIRWVIWCLWQTNSPNHWRLKNEGKVLLGAIKWQKGRWPGSTHIVTKCPSPCFEDCERRIYSTYFLNILRDGKSINCLEEVMIYSFAGNSSWCDQG